MRIMQMGKASAVTAENEFHAGYIVDLSGRYFLIETPPCVMNQLGQAGIDTSQIDWIFISHQHGDHCLGLPMILIREYVQKRENPINIILPEQIKPIITQLLLLVYPELETLIAEKVRFYMIDERTKFKMKITADHLVSAAYGAHGVPSAGIRIEDGTSAVVYSGDTCYSENIVALARKADLLIHEIGSGYQVPNLKKHHTTAGEAGNIAAQAQCKKLWFTHIDRFDAEFIEGCIESAKAEFDGKVAVAPDFTWVTV